MKNALVKASRRSEGMVEIRMCRLLAAIAIATVMMVGIGRRTIAGGPGELQECRSRRFPAVRSLHLLRVLYFRASDRAGADRYSGRAGTGRVRQLRSERQFWLATPAAADEFFDDVFLELCGGDTLFGFERAVPIAFHDSEPAVERRKWTVTLTGGAQDTTLAEYLFQPSGLSVLSQLPATTDDLAAAFSIGQFSNSQMASMLTGASMLQSPARGLLLGNRVLSYSANAGLNYAHSSRLSFHFAAFSAGGQNPDGRAKRHSATEVRPCRAASV